MTAENVEAKRGRQTKRRKNCVARVLGNMPPLCLCAAVAPLHETILSELNPTLDHDQMHHRRHSHNLAQHQNQRTCTKVIVEVSRRRSDNLRMSDFMSQIRAMCESFLRIRMSDEPDFQASSSSSPVPSLRPDLAEIPRVGFPPIQTRVCSSGNTITHNRASRRSTLPTAASKTTLESQEAASKMIFKSQDVVKKLPYLFSSTDGRSFIRIEAIYI